MKKITLSISLRWITCICFGVMVGFVAITSADVPPQKIDTIDYQNFSLIAGAVLGLILCLPGRLIYWLGKNRLSTHREGFIYAISVVTGAAIGALASYYVQISADNYGMVLARPLVIITLTVIPAFFGGLIPSITLLIVKS